MEEIHPVIPQVASRPWPFVFLGFWQREVQICPRARFVQISILMLVLENL